MDLADIIFIVLGLCGCLFVLALVITILVIVIRRRQKNKQRDLQWQQVVHGTQPSISTSASAQPGSIETTLPGSSPPPASPPYSPGPDVLASLLILQSNDGSLINKHIEMKNPLISLGRKADNDVVFAKDGLVSRRHATIAREDAGLILNEVLTPDDEGKLRPPTFGTFVNGNQVTGPTPITNGDEIALGKNVTLRLVYISPRSLQNDETMDLLFEDKDETVDDFGDPQA